MQILFTFSASEKLFSRIFASFFSEKAGQIGNKAERVESFLCNTAINSPKHW